MSALTEPAALLRPGLLDGVTLLLAGAGGSRGTAIETTLGELGARVSPWPMAGGSDAPVAAAAPGAGDVDLLVVDAATVFAANQEDALRVSLDLSWEATQEVVTAAFIEPGRPGRVLYVAPAPDAGLHADAARAGLENLARTLSIEWARYAISTATIALGAQTSDGELAALLAYLASAAGDYFSGCQLDLRGI
jgi:NAD(P)-dependent dehydrogenase (short-subunit alcohol dehydrogenase family)